MTPSSALASRQQNQKSAEIKKEDSLQGCGAMHCLPLPDTGTGRGHGPRTATGEIEFGDRGSKAAHEFVLSLDGPKRCVQPTLT